MQHHDHSNLHPCRQTATAVEHTKFALLSLCNASKQTFQMFYNHSMIATLQLNVSKVCNSPQQQTCMHQCVVVTITVCSVNVVMLTLCCMIRNISSRGGVGERGVKGGVKRGRTVWQPGKGTGQNKTFRGCRAIRAPCEKGSSNVVLLCV